jgi:hypothetical protein
MMVVSLIMRTHYLHLSAFPCGECNGPVISGAGSTRETEIQRETNIRQIGSVCLSCGKRYVGLPGSGVVHHMAPFEWNWVIVENPNKTSTTFDSAQVA